MVAYVLFAVVLGLWFLPTLVLDNMARQANLNNVGRVRLSLWGLLSWPGVLLGRRRLLQCDPRPQ